jgi:hypothetical protein
MAKDAEDPAVMFRIKLHQIKFCIARRRMIAPERTTAQAYGRY